MTFSTKLRYFADRRWPAGTGIGIVQSELEARRPADVEIVDLDVKGSIGSPFSPLRVTQAIRKHSKSKQLTYLSFGFIPPLLHAGRSIVLVHDLTHLHYYGTFKRVYYDVVLKRLYRNCEAIICPSDYTKCEFVKWSKINPDKIHTIYNGCSEAFRINDEKLDLGFKYIVYPGNYRNYKNLIKLIQSYAKSNVSQIGVHLVMTGSGNSDLNKTSKQYGVADYVHFIGKLPESDMPKLYSGAIALLFISLYEGFGLPIVEAMASGVPVITSNVTSMPEIAGDAALIVDPHSENEISAAIRRVSTDEKLRQDLIDRGIERATHFSWDKMAVKFWSLANRVSLS